MFLIVHMGWPRCADACWTCCCCKHCNQPDWSPMLSKGSQTSNVVLLSQGLFEGKLPTAGGPGKSSEWAGHACAGHQSLCTSAGHCAATKSGRGLQHCAFLPVCNPAVAKDHRQRHCCSSLRCECLRAKMPPIVLDTVKVRTEKRTASAAFMHS